MIDTKHALIEIISAFTIAILMIPESIAFALMVDKSPSVGIQTSIVISIVAALLGGQPGLISGSTAAVATALVGLVSHLGSDYVSTGVIFGGIIQLIIGVTGLYKLFDFIPKAVNSGFLIGLSILILMGQTANFQDKSGKWLTGLNLWYTCVLSAIGVFLTYYGNTIINLTHFFNIPIHIPGALIGILILSLFFYLTPGKLPVETVSDKGDVKGELPSFQVPNPKGGLDMMTILQILPYSFSMALSGLTESLFMVKDAEATIGRKGSTYVETFAQGIANIVSGFTGGMGGCVLVGQSKFNLENGSISRLSSIAVSAFLAIFVLFASRFIDAIPIPAIIAILIVIALKTCDIPALFQKFGKNWVVTAYTALISVYTSNLAVGVVTGTALHKIMDVFISKYGGGKENAIDKYAGFSK